MKKFLLILGIFASMMFANTVSAALINIGGGENHGDDLSAVVQYDFNNGTLSFEIENTSSLDSFITAFAFNADGSVLDYPNVSGWTNTHTGVTPPQSNIFGSNFSYGLSTGGPTWQGSSTNDGIGNSGKVTFDFEVSDSFQLFDNDKGYSFIVRYQGVGFDGEGSDIGGGSPVPIPAAVWLLGSGMLGLVAIRRRRS